MRSGQQIKIYANQSFQHAGNLVWPFGSPDPRTVEFDHPDVEVDLRKCQFVRPGAVLWCIVYLLLASHRGSKCRLLVPEDAGVCIYLKSLELFTILQHNDVEVDDRGIPYRSDTQLVLPLTRFNSESEVETLANRALETLVDSKLGAANLRPLVSEIFAELALNAIQHSQSPIGAYGVIQFYKFEGGERFICGVADGGIGIRHSLERNPELRSRVPYDWVAIELAVRERISGTGDPMRGIGLYGVAEDMRRAGRSLFIHSGLGLLHIDEKVESEAKRTRLFPGTLASASIPT